MILYDEEYFHQTISFNFCLLYETLKWYLPMTLDCITLRLRCYCWNQRILETKRVDRNCEGTKYFCYWYQIHGHQSVIKLVLFYIEWRSTSSKSTLASEIRYILLEESHEMIMSWITSYILLLNSTYSFCCRTQELVFKIYWIFVFVKWKLDIDLL